jgi:hypothetical protein
LSANVSFDGAAQRALTLGNNVMINLGDKIFYGESGGKWHNLTFNLVIQQSFHSLVLRQVNLILLK